MILSRCKIHECSQNNIDRPMVISHPEGEFQVFSSPHLHPRVVRPQVMEVVLLHSKQTTCHCRRPAGKNTNLGEELVFCFYTVILSC